jgi:hypothetical protein
MNEFTQNLKLYIKKLENFDYSYEFSDDTTKVLTGRLDHKYLLSLQEKVDPTGHIWFGIHPQTATDKSYAQPKVQ